MTKKQVFKTEENGLIYRFKLDAFNKTVAEVAYASEKDIDVISIPNSIQNIPVVSVAAGAFIQMRFLKEVYFESSASINVDKEAFALCPNLEKVESHSDNLILQKKAFFKTPLLEKVFCYGHISLMGENIFFQSNYLEKIYGKIAMIQPHALSGATSLKKLCFSKNTQIYSEAFNGCNLSELWFTGDAEFIAPATPEMLKEYKILCMNSSNIAELAYEGYNIETTAMMNALAF